MLKRPQELDEEIAYVRAKDFVECGRTLFKDYQHREDVKRFPNLSSSDTTKQQNNNNIRTAM
jgi:hypothetical protein